MKKISAFILSLTVLLLCFSSVAPASAHDIVANDKTNLVESVEENSLLETDNEISPLFIPCDYFMDGNHRYTKTGQRTVAKSSDTEEVTVKRPDGSLMRVTCTFINYYTVSRYNCPCGDYYDNAGTFSHTTHSVDH